MMFPANQQAAKISHPTKATLDAKALLVGFPVRDPRPSVLFAPFGRSLLSRNAHLNATLLQTATKVTTGIATVSHQLAWSGFDLPLAASHAHGFKRWRGQSNLSRGSTVEMKANGQTVAIGHQHPFSALAFLGVAYCSSPFLAGTKLPSRNACAHSSFSCLSSVESTARHSCSHTPASSHARSRRHAGEDEPNSRGRAHQRQPVRNTKSIASSVWRSAARGRPRVLGGGRCGAIMFHCLSLNLLAALIPKS